MDGMARLMTSCPAEELSASTGQEQDDVNRELKRVIATIYIITSLLSMLGAGSVIVFAVIKKIVRSAEVRPLFHLAVADFLLSVNWLFGAAVWMARESHPNDMSSKGIICFYLDVTAEVFHLASFFLTVNYGINVYVRLREKTYNLNNLRFSLGNSGESVFYRWMFVAFYLISWLLPVIIMIPLLIKFSGKIKILDNPHCSRCLLLFDRPRPLEDNGSLSLAWILYGSIVLVTSLCFSIVALMILYFMANRVYQRSVMRSGVLTDTQRSSIDTMRNRIFLYILVFLVCWGPALVVASADLQPRRRSLGIHRWFPLFIAQGLTAPMQGFLNSLVYGWTRRTFRYARNRQPLLESADQSRLDISYGSTTGSL